MSEGVLNGIRVLDLAHGIAGPVAAMMLGEAGADVVKVETAVGSAADRALPGFLTWNRSKRNSSEVATTASGADSSSCTRRCLHWKSR